MNTGLQKHGPLRTLGSCLPTLSMGQEEGNVKGHSGQWVVLATSMGYLSVGLRRAELLRKQTCVSFEMYK